MKVGYVTSSVSRQAGGLLSGPQMLAQSVDRLQAMSSCVYGLEDEYSTLDLPSWQPIIPEVFPIIGPRIFGYGAGMAAALDLQKFDILHSHGLWMYPSFAANRYAMRTNTPHIITPHGMLDPWALANSGWKKRLAGILYENKHLHNAACIQSLCSSETDAIRAYGLKNPICLVPNGIDLPLPGKNYQRPPWGNIIPTGKKILLYLGRIHPKKGLKNLLDAWSKVCTPQTTMSCDWVLVIAGWSQEGYKADLEMHVSEAGMSRNVFFIGPQFNEAKAACFHHADAFVLPSLSEGLPMVVLESWAYELPVLMTPQCNIPEGFVSGAAIKLMPSSNGIALGLRNLFEMSDTDLMQMGNNGFSLVKRTFTWDKVASDMLAVYEWMLGNGGLPSCITTD